MISEINLLYSKKQLQRYKLTSKVRLIRYISLGVLFLVCILSVGFFLLVIASPLTSLKRQELQLNQELVQSQEKIRQQTLISLRMGDIASIIQKRSQYDQILTLLIAKLPSGMTITNFSAEKRQVTVTVKSISVIDIERYLGVLGALVTNKQSFSRVFLGSLRIDVGEADQSFFKAQIVLSLL